MIVCCKMPISLGQVAQKKYNYGILIISVRNRPQLKKNLNEIACCIYFSKIKKAALFVTYI